MSALVSARPPEQAEGRVPNLIIAGASKAGTTSLYYYLAQHPEVCPSDIKELRYFVPLRHGRSVAPVQSYAAHFSHCGQTRYAMEATPEYFYGGSTIARAMHKTCGDVRVVVSLRSPEERCWSWFRFVRSRTRIPKEMSFEEYLDRCERLHRAGTDGDADNAAFGGLGGGCYDTYLDSWVAEFGANFQLVFFDDLVDRRDDTLKDLCAWLDIDTSVVDCFDYSVENKTEQYHSRRLQEAAVAFNRRHEGFFARHREAKRSLRRAYYMLNRSRADLTMSDVARERLRVFYEPHIERLRAQLATMGRTLPNSWCPEGTSAAAQASNPNSS